MLRFATKINFCETSLRYCFSKMCENFPTEERYLRSYLLSNRLRESVISLALERQTTDWCASLLVMDTSQGGSSQDIHSLNEISFSFIVLGYCYFSLINRKHFISKFCGYSMEIRNIRFPNTGFYMYFG